MGNSDNNNRIELTMYEHIILESNIIPNNIIEIGSHYGHDAHRLARKFNIENNNVYIIEAHPEFCQNIKNDYPSYNIYNNAIFDKNGTLTFNKALNEDDGRSSILDRDIYNSNNFDIIEVQSLRMDTFIKLENISTIDLLKIDVEGASYQVLCSFGDKLQLVKSLQIESELQPYWKNSVLWPELKNYLEINGFILKWHTKLGNSQVDSVWINKEYLK